MFKCLGHADGWRKRQGGGGGVIACLCCEESNLRAIKRRGRPAALRFAFENHGQVEENH